MRARKQGRGARETQTDEWRPAGAENRHVLACDRAIAGNQDEIFDRRLSDRHPVERIGTMALRRRRQNRMYWADRQNVETLAAGDVVELLDGKNRAAGRRRDRDFPNARGADENADLRCGHGLPRGLVHSGERRHRPNRVMRIEQEI